MRKRQTAEQRQAVKQDKEAAAKVLRASLRERIEFLDRKPDRTAADIRQANQLVRQRNRLLFKPQRAPIW